MIGLGLENGHMWMTFAVILAAVILFAIDRIPLELTAGLTVITLLVLFHFFPLETPPGHPPVNITTLLAGFATPIAYQTNLIVMGPGHYRFRDFMVAGIPLILIIWIAYSLFAPMYFGM